MGDIVPLNKKMRDQHGAGPAFCIACNHEWYAIAPTGTEYLYCPNCMTQKGRFKFPFAPDATELTRQCKCGNQLFYITPKGHLCANCGIYQVY